MAILWLVMALALVGPAAYRIIRHQPQLALTSVAGWLGIALVAVFVYQYAGVGEWWEAKHGGGGSFQTEQPEQPSDPNDDPVY